MTKSLPLILLLFLSSCAYKIDIQQGNILSQTDINKLRPELTKEQVIFVLGSPIIDDAFSDDKWIYLYSYKDSNQNKYTTKKLELYFSNDKLISAKSENYDIPKALSTKLINETNNFVSSRNTYLQQH